MLPTSMLVVSGLMLLLAVFAFWQSVRALFGSGVDEISAAIGGDRAALVDEKNSLLRALKDIEFERAVGKISDVDWKRLDASYRARAKDVLGELDKDLGPWREKAEKLVQERLGKSSASGSAKGKAKSKAQGKAKAKGAEPVARASDATSSAEPADELSSAEPADEVSSAESSEDASSGEPAEETAAEEPAAKAAAPVAAVEKPAVADAAEKPAAAVEAAAKQICPSCAAQNESDAVFCKKCAVRLAASATEEAS